MSLSRIFLWLVYMGEYVKTWTPLNEQYSQHYTSSIARPLAEKANGKVVIFGPFTFIQKNTV